MEVALVEMNLPNNLSTSTQNMNYYLNIWVYFMAIEGITDVKIEGEDENFYFSAVLRINILNWIHILEITV